MKNIRNYTDKWLESLDRRWNELPIKKQHQYLLYFFAGYLLITVMVIANVWSNTVRSGNDLGIEHIESTATAKKKSSTALQDTLKSTLKNKIYERK